MVSPGRLRCRRVPSGEEPLAGWGAAPGWVGLQLVLTAAGPPVPALGLSVQAGLPHSQHRRRADPLDRRCAQPAGLHAANALVLQSGPCPPIKLCACLGGRPTHQPCCACQTSTATSLKMPHTHPPTLFSRPPVYRPRHPEEHLPPRARPQGGRPPARPLLHPLLCQPQVSWGGSRPMAVAYDNSS